jgi:hypothetical protein
MSQLNFSDFKNKYRHLPLLVSRDIYAQVRDKQAFLNQLTRWQEKKLIVKLKRGMYLLNENDRKVQPGLSFLANQLYGPSYVSLEYALSFYNLIPEGVYTVTSITTKKTQRFENSEGVFVYQHIQPQAFRGFAAFKDEAGLPFFMASPEKAVVDFLYFHLPQLKKDDIGIFEGSYRFQGLDILRQKRIMGAAEFFNNPRLTRAARLFCKFMKSGG